MKDEEDEDDPVALIVEDALQSVASDPGLEFSPFWDEQQQKVESFTQTTPREPSPIESTKSKTKAVVETSTSPLILSTGPTKAKRKVKQKEKKKKKKKKQQQKTKTTTQMQERDPSTMAEVIAAARAIKRQVVVMDTAMRDNKGRLERLEKAKRKSDLTRVEEVLEENERRRRDEQQKRDLRDSMLAARILQSRAAKELREKQLEALRKESERKKALLEAALDKLREDRERNLAKLHRESRVSQVAAVTPESFPVNPTTIRRAAITTSSPTSPSKQSMFSEMVREEAAKKREKVAAMREEVKNRRDSQIVYGELVREMYTDGNPPPNSSLATPQMKRSSQPPSSHSKGRITPMTYHLLVTTIFTLVFFPHFSHTKSFSLIFFFSSAWNFYTKCTNIKEIRKCAANAQDEDNEWEDTKE